MNTEKVYATEEENGWVWVRMTKEYGLRLEDGLLHTRTRRFSDPAKVVTVWEQRLKGAEDLFDFVKIGIGDAIARCMRQGVSEIIVRGKDNSVSILSIVSYQIDGKVKLVERNKNDPETDDTGSEA